MFCYHLIKTVNNRTKFVGVDFLKVHRFSLLVLVVKKLSLTCGKSMM